MIKYIDWDEYWQPVLRDEQYFFKGKDFYVPVDVSQEWYDNYLRVKTELNTILNTLIEWEQNGRTTTKQN